MPGEFSSLTHGEGGNKLSEVMRILIDGDM
jgi:hypothetical protein